MVTGIRAAGEVDSDQGKSTSLGLRIWLALDGGGG
jgi:hypothetical protein